MSVWTELSHDPRGAGLAGLRASDADRDVVQALLNQAYADGRLTPVEHDERATLLSGATTLGDLRVLIIDLAPVSEPNVSEPSASEPAGSSPDPSTRSDPAGRRRGLLIGFLLPSLVCVLLWRFGSPHLFWPLWVMVYTGLPLLWEARGVRRRR